MNALTTNWALAKAALDADRRQSKSLVRVDEAAFLPAALEIVERPVSPTARLTGKVLMVCLFLTVIWLLVGRVDIVASAPGKLLPAGNVKIVQPAIGGVVRAIHVADGQSVTKGQLLMELDPAASDAEARASRDALTEAQLTVARLRAVLGALNGSGFAFAPPAGTPPQLAATHAALARAQLSQVRADIAAQSSDRQAAYASAAEARTQAAKMNDTLPLLQQQIDANEALLEKGYVSKLRVIEMRRQYAAALRDRDAAAQMASRAAAQASSAGSAAVRTGAAGRTAILEALVAAEAEAALRLEVVRKADAASGYARILAPADGIVTQLAMHTEGGVVEPAKPLMAIVPRNGAMVADVMLADKDIGFVKPGQKVTLLLSPYPASRHGSVTGRVRTIGATAIEDPKRGLVYPVRVTLDPATAANFPLRAGMGVVADINTGSRTLMAYLISPIESATRQAVRER